MGKDWLKLQSAYDELFPEWKNAKSCTDCVHVEGWHPIQNPNPGEQSYVISCKKYDKPISDFLTEAESCVSFERVGEKK